MDFCIYARWHYSEGSATLNFCQHDSEIFRLLAWFQDSWIDSCDSYLPNKGLYITRFIMYKNTKYPRISIKIMIRDTRISTWFCDSSSDSKRFLKPSTWFGIVADPSHYIIDTIRVTDQKLLHFTLSKSDQILHVDKTVFPRSNIYTHIIHTDVCIKAILWN